MAENSENVQDLTSAFDRINQVLLGFLADEKGNNRFIIIKSNLFDLGVTPSFSVHLQRASSLREALEDWKFEIANVVSNFEDIIH